MSGQYLIYGTNAPRSRVLLTTSEEMSRVHDETSVRLTAYLLKYLGAYVLISKLLYVVQGCMFSIIGNTFQNCSMQRNACLCTRSNMYLT